jgi:hypothetical protein
VARRQSEQSTKIAKVRISCVMGYGYWHTIVEGQNVGAEFSYEALLGAGELNVGVNCVGAFAAETVTGENLCVYILGGYSCRCHG